MRHAEEGEGGLRSLVRGELAAVETYRQALEKAGASPGGEELRRIESEHEEAVCPVVEASGGREALRALKRERPRLMLLDVSMPGLDGMAVLRAARRLDPGLDVLMLTGAADLESARLALEAGARAYITKPFDVAGLRAEARRLLEGEPSPGSPPWRIKARPAAAEWRGRADVA